MKKGNFFSAKRITGLAVLFALVIVLQMLGGYFRIGATSLSFVLVPIVLGGILYGPIAGGLLGFTFGFIVLMYGVTGADVFTAILFADHPVLTVLTCIVKGVAAGVGAGCIYKLFEKKHPYVGVFAASAAAPVLNTGLFILGALLMSDTLRGNFVANGQTVLYFLIIGCAGINFLVELAINLIASPSVYRVMNIVSGKRMRGGAPAKTQADENTHTEKETLE